MGRVAAQAGDAQDSAGWGDSARHFVNNVLAMAAGCIDEDPAIARETLARLGAVLSVQLAAEPEPVSLAREIDLVRDYLALEQARFPDRLEIDVASGRFLPAVAVWHGSVARVVQEVVTRRLEERRARCLVVLRPAGRDMLRLEVSDHPGGAVPERHRLALEPAR
jgi:two-component system LytT family sensor kinase